MLKTMSEGVINARGMLPFLECQLKSLIRSKVLGHLHYGGMDIVGPLPIVATQKKFLLIATDYFSKWVEAEAYASIKDKDVSKFVWRNIVCQLGISQASVADNGPQFDSIAFRTFYSKLKIKNLYSMPRYPQSNGQVEATNKTLLTTLKKRPTEANGKWVDKLLGVMWAYRTTPR